VRSRWSKVVGAALAAVGVVVGQPAMTSDPAHAGALRGSTSGYVLNHNPDATVVRWNPCAPVHYRVDLARAPDGALADVREAVARISAATGLRFADDGSTEVIPQSDYGRGTAPTAPPPLVIAWAAPGRGPGRSDLLGDELGWGGWVTRWWSDGDGAHAGRIVTGYVVINTASNELPGGFDAHPGGSRGELLMHELGHAVGLGHATDPGQLMYPTLGAWPGVWGAGDTAGLRVVGSGGCLS
jgi:Matrixin